MTLNSYKIIPITLTGILLAFSSQLCQAGDGPPTTAELANATYTARFLWTRSPAPSGC